MIAPMDSDQRKPCPCCPDCSLALDRNRMEPDETGLLPLPGRVMPRDRVVEFSLAAQWGHNWDINVLKHLWIQKLRPCLGEPLVGSVFTDTTVSHWINELSICKSDPRNGQGKYNIVQPFLLDCLNFHCCLFVYIVSQNTHGWLPNFDHVQSESENRVMWVKQSYSSHVGVAYTTYENGDNWGVVQMALVYPMGRPCLGVENHHRRKQRTECHQLPITWANYWRSGKSPCFNKPSILSIDPFSVADCYIVIFANGDANKWFFEQFQIYSIFLVAIQKVEKWYLLTTTG